MQTGHKTLLLEMKGAVIEPDSALARDEWFGILKKTRSNLVFIKVPLELANQDLAPLSVRDLEPTRANTLHVPRSSSCCARRVGPTHALQLSRKVWALVSELPDPRLGNADLDLGSNKGRDDGPLSSSVGKRRRACCRCRLRRRRPPSQPRSRGLCCQIVAV